jgi:hypothetical protein
MGILAEGPVLVKAIAFHPADVTQVFTLKWWDERTPPTLQVRNCTYTIDLVGSDHHVKATTNVFPTTWLDGNVVRCITTTGSDTRKYGLIKTAGDLDEFTVHLIPFTAEATKVGDWDCYPTYTAFTSTLETVADSHRTHWYPFGGEGFWFPNLALDFLSASATVVIYVG